MTGILNKVVDKSCLTFPYQYTKAEELLASAIKPLHLRKRGRWCRQCRARCWPWPKALPAWSSGACWLTPQTLPKRC